MAKSGTWPFEIKANTVIKNFNYDGSFGETPINQTFTGYDYFSGESNPFWKSQVRSHTSATTPAYGTKMTASLSPYAYTYWAWATTPISIPGFRHTEMVGYALDNPISMPSSGLESPEADEANNLAIHELYDRISSLASPAHVGEDLGEIGQTARMIRRPLKSLISFTNGLFDAHNRALSYNNVKKAAKALADTTLEYKFGIKPLMRSSVDAFMSLKDREFVFHYAPFSAQGRATNHSSSGFTISPAFAPTIASLGGTLIEQCEAVVRYKGEYKYQSDVNQRTVRQALGLEFRDIVPTVYNLIPYSFLLDYVSNVADFISVVCSPWGDVAWCNKTTRSSRSRSYTVDSPGLAGAPWHGHDLTFQPGHMKFGRVDFARSNQSTRPVPTLQLKMPNAGQLTNVAALLAARLPILGKATRSALSRNRNLDGEYKRALLSRGSDSKIPYPVFTF
jgi:hypothetical protein